MTVSQSQRILADLKAGHSITPIDALVDYGCFRLGARIHELKQEGHVIHSEMVPTDTGKHVASYSLGVVHG